MPNYENCSRCGGTGISGPCPSCKGTGVKVILGVEQKCSECNGKGEEICSHCYGSGCIGIDEI